MKHSKQKYPASALTPGVPLCCSTETYTTFARQVPVIESTDALLRAATAIARYSNNNDDSDNDASYARTFADIERQLSGYARLIRSRVRGTQQQALLAHLHHYLFDEVGFTGNSDDYYNPANSYLPDVLHTRHGMPITLSLIYKVVAEKLEQSVKGIGLPGHFLTRLDTDTGVIYVDCFAGGRIMTPDECRLRVESIFGETVEWNPQMLQPVTHRMWLSRMIQNLLHIFTTNQQWNNVAAMLELQMLLWPTQTQLQRDLALVLARIDMPAPASVWLNSYLRANPNDPEHDELTELLVKLSQ
jgi:regulator of sirC expression with transglutaminase-like and TPR domain